MTADTRTAATTRSAHEMLGNRDPAVCSCRACGWARGGGARYVSPRTRSSEALSRMTWDQVDGWYRQGCLTQDEFEAYMHVWATHPAHDGYSLGIGWTDVPTDPAVVAIVVEIRSCLS